MRKKNSAFQRDWNIAIGNAPSNAASPAKFTFDINATPSCSNDYVVFPVNVSGSTQANLIGFNNLYVPGLCGSGSSPSFKFAYKIGTGVIQTSPVLSLDGTKIAFVESVNGASKFHVLKIGTTGSNGTSTSGVTPGSGNNAVDTTVSPNLGAQVTRSSPFVDYGSDTAYVGDDAGKLHKFSCVFDPANTACSLTEAGSPWPVSVGATTTLTGPVVDGTNVFVADSGNNIHRITTSGVKTTLALGTTGGILDAPIVDGSTHYVIVSGQTGSDVVVIQVLGTGTFTSLARTVTMGQEGSSNYVHNGAFDNDYLTGADPSAGWMYFCGRQAIPNDNSPQPFLRRVGFSSTGLMNASRDSSSFNMGNGGGGSGEESECSPLTEVYNPNAAGGAKDLLFIAFSDNGCGSSGGSSSACVASFDITSGMPSAYSATFDLPGTLANSGIVVDNVTDVVPSRLPSRSYAQNALVLDSNGNVQQKTDSGTETSGSGTPTWSTTVGNTTSDGQVTWTMRGKYTGSWQPSHAYTANSIVTDASNHFQRISAAGTSGTTQPTFSTSGGNSSNDNGRTWADLGAYTPSSVSSIYLAHIDGSSSRAYKLTQAGLN